MFRLGALALGLATAVHGIPEGNPPEHSGASIFKQRCASCHGIEGQGVPEKYDEPLHGDRSIASLSRLIERTMPEGEPETCVGDEARQVANYIYHEFYSPQARQKKGLVAAPRFELARMTVPQYRNAVADLLARFTPAPRNRLNPPEPDGTQESPDTAVLPGWHAEYFQSKGMSKADSLQLERADHSIDFDFGEDSPSEKITADQFTIIWQGALLARNTGHHEFRISTQNGARLYLNSDATERIRKLRDDSSQTGQSAFIDGWVSSGEMRELTGRIFLLEGRRYPLRLEFFKYKEKTASIKLEWKPPHGRWSLLGHSDVTTDTVGRTFVVDTPFPADDRSLGYERGSSISRAWQAATMKAATATASEVVDRLPLLAGFNEGDAKREGILRDFLARFARVAFRRPLADDEDRLFRETLFTDAANPEAAVRRGVILALMSPSFLYVDLTPATETPDQHAIASRLSFALWDSMPDRPLVEAADHGQLRSPEQIQAEARRMIRDPRARNKMRDFFRHWLELEDRDLAKDKNLFPEFDEAVIADLRNSLELFTEQIIWSESSDYRQLLLADYLLMNDRLRRLYAPNQPDCDSSVELASAACSEGGFELVRLPSGRRAGVLTHPYLLSAFAYANNTSPIHRGVFLTRNIIGRPLKPPPVAVAFKEDEFSRESTMREKVTQLTRDAACMSCHSVINPLGFALENYDAVGRWRTTDNNQPIDSKGAYVTDEGTTVDVESAFDVARYAAGSEAAHRAFVRQIFHHLVKKDSSVYGPGTLERLRTQFEHDNFNVQHLMVRIAALSAGHGQTSTAVFEGNDP